MRGKLPDVIKLPASVTVPFGSFEQALSAKANRDVKQRLEAAVAAIPDSAAETQLKQCRDIAMEARALLPDLALAPAT
jgi:alpha-glucan,water dikinase